MPTFQTPRPVSVDIDMLVGSVTITASDRADTEVTVEPGNPADESDVEAAEQTRVELSNDTLLIKGQGFRKYIGWNNKSRSIALSIALPTGSHVSGGSVGSMIRVKTVGRLGSCRFKIGTGDIFVERAGSVKLRTAGDIVVEQADGDADLYTGFGRLQVGLTSGNLTAKNSHGHCVIGEVGGTANLRSSNGDITVDHARGDLTAVTAHGGIRVAEVSEGAVDLKTAMGAIEVGVPEGTTAWLDVQSKFGAIHSRLSDSGEPAPGVPVVKIRARTAYGDLVIDRP